MTLTRRHPLKRRSHLKSSKHRTARESRNDPARLAWKEDRAGFCPVCTNFAMHLEHHHVVEAQTLRQMGRDDLLWDQRNGMRICTRCHERHTTAFKRIPLPCVPDEAVAFAVDLFGSDLAAADYFSRRYLPEIPDSEQHLWRWQP